MKRTILSLILAMLLASSSFTMFACGESEVNSNPDENKTAVGETAGDTLTESETADETVNERLLIPDELPEEKFGGRTFSVLTQNTVAGFDYITEIIAEDLNGDACNDAVYNRNGLIEERFEIDIACTTSGSPQDDVKTIATAGTQDYQIVGFHDYVANVPIMGGALLNWVDAPYVDLDKPWHNALANDEATINGILYAICSDLSISSMTYTHAIFANTARLDEYGYSADYMYDLVKEGKWTFDTMSQMVEGMYVDENGDGTADTYDIYGFGYNVTNPADVWLTALGGNVCEIKDGVIELTFMSDKTVSMFEKVYDFHYENVGYIKLAEQYAEEKYFLNGQLAMAPMRFAAAFNALREMEETYIMIPFPKWDELQEGYYTNADDKFSVFGMPLSVAGDMEFISIIFEALCAESYKTVYPTYYDTALKGKYSSDPTTAEMVDLIMAGRKFSYSFQFPTVVFQRLPHLFRDMINDQNRNLASKYKTIDKTTKKSIELIINPAYDLD